MRMRCDPSAIGATTGNRSTGSRDPSGASVFACAIRQPSIPNATHEIAIKLLTMAGTDSVTQFRPAGQALHASPD